MLGLAVLSIAVISGCGGDESGDGRVDRDMELAAAETGGFDDWSSPGAAMGYAVDPEQRLILVTALKFSLSFYTGEFEPPSSARAALDGYQVRPANGPLTDDVARYPLLATAITDTTGVRALSGSQSVTAILLEGDFQRSSPERVWVSDGGSLTLTREDDYFDYLDGRLILSETSGLGDGASVLGDGERVRIRGLAFSFNTVEQP
jgi:hypothetical protein